MSNSLFEYGIHVEQSDVRAHVSVVNKSIYVFETLRGVDAIKRLSPPIRCAFQPGVNGPTAEGWLVALGDICDLRILRFHSWSGWSEFCESATTSAKGALAVSCVREAMRVGRFPFWINAMEDDRQNIQIAGTDIVVFCRKRVQVKCDYRSGEKPAGTGNLFLQKAERNPLRRH